MRPRTRNLRATSSTGPLLLKIETTRCRVRRTWSCRSDRVHQASCHVLANSSLSALPSFRELPDTRHRLLKALRKSKQLYAFRRRICKLRRSDGLSFLIDHPCLLFCQLVLTLDLLALGINVGIRLSGSTALSSHCSDCFSIVSSARGGLEDRSPEGKVCCSQLPRALMSGGHGGSRGTAVHSVFSSPAPARVTLAHASALHEAVGGVKKRCRRQVLVFLNHFDGVQPAVTR